MELLRSWSLNDWHMKLYVKLSQISVWMQTRSISNNWIFCRSHCI